MGPRSDFDLQPADPEDIPNLLGLCSAPNGVINDALAEQLHGIAIAIQETRIAQDVKPYTLDDLRIVTHFAVMAATAHRRQKRRSGKGYFEDHIVGSVANLIEHLGRTRVPVIGATFNHDIGEDAGIVTRDAYWAAWKSTFADPTDPLIPISHTAVDRSRKLMDAVTKVRLEDHEATDAATARKLLRGIGLLGLDALDPKLADALHNMSTLDTQKPERRKPIAAKSYDLYCRFGDITGVQNWVRKCADWCAQELNRSLRTDFSVQSRATIREVLDDTRIPGRPTTVRQYIDHFLGSLENVVSFRVVPFELADFTMPLDASLQDLTIDQLAISSMTPLFEYEIIVKQGTDKETVVRDIIRHCTNPGDRISVEDEKDSDFPNRGISVVVSSEKVGLIKFRINDSISEARSIRGVRQMHMQSALASETVPAHIKTAVPLILRATRDDVTQTLTLARRLFLRPLIAVWTPKGTLIQLPYGSCAADFAAQIHSRFAARRVDRVLCHYSPGAWKTIGPYDPLEPGTTVELIWSASPDTMPDPRSLVFTTTEHARKRIRQELKNKSPEELQSSGKKYATELSKLFGISIDEILWSMRVEKEMRVQALAEKDEGADDDRQDDLLGFGDDEDTEESASTPLDILFDDNAIFQQIGSGKIEPLSILSRIAFAGKKTWKIRVCLPNEPGILRKFLGEFEREGINVDRIFQIPPAEPKPHILRMRVSDTRKDSSSIVFMKALLKLDLMYPNLTVNHRLAERRWSERIKDGWELFKYMTTRWPIT